ncbi:MAG: phenylalanine--tRNA ligase subunit beta, partial [Bacillota bacterium]
RIVVRRARAGERMRTLDGQERELDEEMLVIADAGRPVGLAGVMGGEDTEVTGSTREVLMEAAWFDPISIRRTSRRLGLRTAAAARFEKGIDPAGVLAASRRACHLLEELGVARVVPGAVDVRAREYGPRPVEFRPARVGAVLGLDIPRAATREALVRLGFSVTAASPAASTAPATAASPAPDRGLTGRADERWEVAVPTWRGDVVGEIDLIEEVARIHGYERIPSTLPTGSPSAGYLTREQRLIGRARQVLAAAGLSEALTFSLISPDAFDRLGLEGDDPRRRALTTRNPLSVEWSVLRTSLVPGLLGCLAHNQAHRVTRAGLFEIAAVYLPGELPPRELPAERLYVAGATYGPWWESHWSGGAPETDYFHMKGVVEYLLDVLGVRQVEYTPAGEPYLHPGRQARLTAGGHLLGVVGELHPRAARVHQLEGRVALFELDFTTLLALAGEERLYRPLPRFPAVTRDVAFMLADHIPAARAEEVIRLAGGPLLESVRLFDVYRGEGILPGHRSLGYSLTYRSPEQTLTDREVDEIHAEVRHALEVDLGATLR